MYYETSNDLKFNHGVCPKYLIASKNLANLSGRLKQFFFSDNFNKCKLIFFRT